METFFIFQISILCIWNNSWIYYINITYHNWFWISFLGANYIINNLGLNVSKLLPESLSLANEGNLILEIINSLKSKSSITLGLFLLCLITSIHSSTALFLNFSIKSYINNIDMDDYKNQNIRLF